jgi:predicted enzyme related to lactoylglutathione lyase
MLKVIRPSFEVVKEGRILYLVDPKKIWFNNNLPGPGNS